MWSRRSSTHLLLATWSKLSGRTLKKGSPPSSRHSSLLASLRKFQTIPVSTYFLFDIFAWSFSIIEMWFIFSAGPWTIFAPTNAAFSNLPILELTNLVKDKARLRRFVFNHLINRSVYSAGLKSHQVLQMANGNNVNIFARRGE